MSEFSFMNVYMPAEGRTSVRDNSIMINPECVEWLDENCGPRAPSYHHWILGLPENQYGWYFRGFDHDPSSDFCKAVRVFLIRDDALAVLFKLAWGG